MITHLEIKGFKSLVDVSIELGAVNVFIGANGSGKSNLLEAVGVLSAITSSGPELESFKYRGVRLSSPASYLSLLRDKSSHSSSLSASDSQSCYEIEIACDEHFASHWKILNERLCVDNNEILTRTEDGIDFHFEGQVRTASRPFNHSSRSIAKYGSFLIETSSTKDSKRYDSADRQGKVLVPIAPNATNAFLEELTQFAIFTPSTPQLRYFPVDTEREPLGLGGSRLSVAIDEMLRGEPGMLGPFDLDDVYELIDWADSLHSEADSWSNGNFSGGPVRLRIGDRFMGEEHKSVSLVEASEGALYVLFMLALAGHEQSPKFFAVDNFDQALHPRLACKLTGRHAFWGGGDRYPASEAEISRFCSQHSW